jgi:hypothetical protein
LKRRDGACWFDSARPRSLQPASDTASAYLRYRHERGEGRYAYAEARASHNRQRFDLGPTAVALGLYGFTFNSVLREAGNVRPQVRATDADRHLRHRPRPGPAQLGRRHQRAAQRCHPGHAGHRARRTVLEAAQSLRFLPGFDALPADEATSLFPSIRNRGLTEQWQGWWGMQRALMPMRGGNAQLATGIDLRQERWTSHPDALLSQGDLALGLPQQQRRLSRRVAAPTPNSACRSRGTAHGPGRTLGPRRRLHGILAPCRPALDANTALVVPAGQRARLSRAQPVRTAAPARQFGTLTLPASSALPPVRRASRTAAAASPRTWWRTMR